MGYSNIFFKNTKYFGEKKNTQFRIYLVEELDKLRGKQQKYKVNRTKVNMLSHEQKTNMLSMRLINLTASRNKVFKE